MKKAKIGTVKKKDSIVVDEPEAKDTDAFHGINPEDFDSEDIARLRKVTEGRKRWWNLIEPYKRINEGMTQFADRCVFDRVAVYRWKTEGKKPKPDNALKILENLGIPDNEAKVIFNKYLGLKETETSTSEDHNYVYPNSEGPDGDGRLGFRSVWLETLDVKSSSVKMVVCDTLAMMPEIRPKDLMLVDMSKITPRSGKIYLLEITDEPDVQIVCRLFVLANKELSVVYENKDVYNKFTIKQDMVVVHGEVVFIGRML